MSSYRQTKEDEQGPGPDHEGGSVASPFCSSNPPPFSRGHGGRHSLDFRRFCAPRTMKRFILLWMAAATNLYGVIGESEAEIKARYGESIETMSTESPREVWKAYKSAGRIIYVAYLDGPSQMETYKLPKNKPLGRTDIEALLKANSGGAEWQRDPRATNGTQRWHRFNVAGEEQAVALYDPKSTSTPFVVMTPAFREYRQTRK